jgi:hypothetical protein
MTLLAAVRTKGNSTPSQGHEARMNGTITKGSAAKRDHPATGLKPIPRYTVIEQAPNGKTHRSRRKDHDCRYARRYHDSRHADRDGIWSSPGSRPLEASGKPGQ